MLDTNKKTMARKTTFVFSAVFLVMISSIGLMLYSPGSTARPKASTELTVVWNPPNIADSLKSSESKQASATLKIRPDKNNVESQNVARAESASSSEHQTPQQWNTYVNTKYGVSFLYPIEIVNEKEAVNIAESPALSVRIDMAADPVSVCMADNKKSLTAKDLYLEWREHPPFESISGFSCGDYPTFATVHARALVETDSNRYEVSTIRGEGLNGSTEKICTYIAGRSAVVVCMPDSNTSSPNYQALLDKYRQLLMSLRLQH